VLDVGQLGAAGRDGSTEVRADDDSGQARLGWPTGSYRLGWGVWGPRADPRWLQGTESTPRGPLGSARPSHRGWWGPAGPAPARQRHVVALAPSHCSSILRGSGRSPWIGRGSG